MKTLKPCPKGMNNIFVKLLDRPDLYPLTKQSELTIRILNRFWILGLKKWAA
jgi:hypothetical protein